MSYGGLRSAWARTLEKYRQAGGAPDFTFHDLKAMGVSYSDNPQEASGHKTLAMTERYDRGIRTVDGTVIDL
jgi:integrase